MAVEIRRNDFWAGLRQVQSLAPEDAGKASLLPIEPYDISAALGGPDTERRQREFLECIGLSPAVVNDLSGPSGHELIDQANLEQWRRKHR